MRWTQYAFCEALTSQRPSVNKTIPHSLCIEWYGNTCTVKSVVNINQALSMTKRLVHCTRCPWVDDVMLKSWQKSWAVEWRLEGIFHNSRWKHNPRNIHRIRMGRGNKASRADKMLAAIYVHVHAMLEGVLP